MLSIRSPSVGVETDQTSHDLSPHFLELWRCCYLLYRSGTASRMTSRHSFLLKKILQHLHSWRLAFTRKMLFLSKFKEACNAAACSGEQEATFLVNDCAVLDRMPKEA
jgi:hypothetical protein